MENIHQWWVLIILSIFEVLLMLILVRSFVKHNEIEKPNEDEKKELEKLAEEGHAGQIWVKAYMQGEIHVWIQVLNIFFLIICSLYLQSQIKIMF